MRQAPEHKKEGPLVVMVLVVAEELEETEMVQTVDLEGKNHQGHWRAHNANSLPIDSL